MTEKKKKNIIMLYLYIKFIKMTLNNNNANIDNSINSVDFNLSGIDPNKINLSKTLNSLNDNGETGRKRPERPQSLPIPHALSMRITDQAFDKLDRYSEEFKIFWDAVKILDYACYMWGSPDIWNNALNKVLNYLVNNWDIQKIKDWLNNLNDNIEKIYKNLNRNYLLQHSKIDYVEDDWEVWKLCNKFIERFSSIFE